MVKGIHHDRSKARSLAETVLKHKPFGKHSHAAALRAKTTKGDASTKKKTALQAKGQIKTKPKPLKKIEPLARKNPGVAKIKTKASARAKTGDKSTSVAAHKAQKVRMYYASFICANPPTMIQCINARPLPLRHPRKTRSRTFCVYTYLSTPTNSPDPTDIPFRLLS